MKTMIRITLLSFLAGFTMIAQAQWNGLVVFAPKGEKFTLYFNGNMQNDTPASRVQVEEVKGPSCKVRLVFETPGIPDLSKTIFNKPSSTMYYALVRNAKNAYVLQSTSSEWSDEPSGAPETVSATAAAEKKTTETQPAKRSDTEKKGCSNPMAEGDFIASLVSVSTAPFDPPKLSAAKKIAAEHCLTTTQVKEIIYLFDNEGTRLSFAKFAYDHTWDVSNYGDVGDALHSDKSRSDLERYISSRK
jgi:hypothetical protein